MTSVGVVRFIVWHHCRISGIFATGSSGRAAAAAATSAAAASGSMMARMRRWAPLGMGRRADVMIWRTCAWNSSGDRGSGRGVTEGVSCEERREGERGCAGGYCGEARGSGAEEEGMAQRHDVAGDHGGKDAVASGALADMGPTHGKHHTKRGIEKDNVAPG